MPTSSRFIKKDIDPLLNIIHQFSYGYSARKDLPENKRKSYDDQLRVLSIFIPEEALKSTKQGKRVQWHFAGDSWMVSNNPFAFVYSLRSFTPHMLKTELLIYQVLASTIQAMQAGKIQEKIRDQFWEYILPKSIKSGLDDLLSYGAITKLNIGKKTCYQCISNPIVKLTKREQQELQLAVDFYKHVWLFSFPGYLLERRLKNLTGHGEMVHFHFPIAHHNSLLEENLTAYLLQDIREKAPVSFTYQSRTSGNTDHYTVLPQTICTDCRHGQNRLEGQSNVLSHFLLENMGDLHLAAPEDAAPHADRKVGKKGKHQVPLRLHFSSEAEKDRLLRDVSAQFSFVEIIRNLPDVVDIVIKAQDPLKLVPSIQRFGASLEVLSPETSQELSPSNSDAIQKIKDRIIENAETALTYYEEEEE